MREVIFAIFYLVLFNFSLLSAQDTCLYYLAEIPDVQIHIDSFNNKIDATIKNKEFSSYDPIIDYNPQFTYWFKFVLKNTSSTSDAIKLRAFVYDSLTLVSFSDQEMIRTHRGLLVKYDQKSLESFQTLSSSKYEFDIDLPAKSKQEFFLRIRNVTRFESNFETIGIYKVENSDFTNTIWYIIFSVTLSSFLLFLSLYSLLQYVQNRDRSFLFYSIFVLLYSIVMWRKFEKANSFINWPFLSQPESYYSFEIPITLLTYSSHFLFLMYFINAKKDLPFFYKILKFGIAASLSYLIIDQLIVHVWDLAISWQVFTMFRFFLIAIATISFYFLFKLGSKLSYYLIVGSFFAFIGAVLTSYLSQTLAQHYYGVWDITLLPNQIAILVEALLLAIGLGYKSRLIEREKSTVLYKLKEEQKEKENQQKSREKLLNWFTNISHEIRTPLTVIIGMTNNIKGYQKEIKLIQRNSNHLLRLINQVLDLSKVESSPLNYIQNDVITYLQYLTESFSSMATDKKIKLTFYSEEDSLLMDYDEAKMQHIIYNLLSNAIKFTLANGTIVLHVQKKIHQNKSFLKIKVKDTGIGIPADQIAHVFDRFYQVDNASEKKREGAGIGLALVYELVQLLKGEIQVESHFGKGTSFILFLPIENNAILKYQKTKLQKIEINHSIEEPQKKSLIPNNINANTILIIEDNEDVILYIESLLQDTYTIFAAKNGQEGIDRAIYSVPDLIISDVMMPIKDGYEVCSTLKKDERTSHIPIILLTAKATHQDRVTGLKYKADVFITKPFQWEELIIQIENLIELRKKLQQRYSAYPMIPNKTAPSNIEDQFLDKLQKLVIEHLADAKFGVSELAVVANMSKTQLYRKLKTLTQKTPSHIIRSIRLQKAKELLKNPLMNISEIAYQVGFSDPNYFSRVFQQEFGHSPSDFRKKL